MKKIPLSEQAYDEIYKKIITLQFAPGEPLEEKHLIESLKIGRTPIREALLRLSTDMLVEARPKKGFMVRPITFQTVKAMFEALELIEVGIAELAVRQPCEESLAKMEEANREVGEAIAANDIYRLILSNNEFHMAFAECASNPYLYRAMKEVRCEANRLAYMSFTQEDGLGKPLSEHYKSVKEDHANVIAHVRNKDEEKLKATVLKLKEGFKTRVIHYLT